MTVYVDVLFAVNFSMDFISLFICAVVMKRKIYKRRMLAAAAIGGIYGVFEVLCTMRTLIAAIVAVLVSFIMCFIAYYEKSIKRFTLMYVMYWGVSATLGGVMSLFYNFLNKILAEQIKNYSFAKVYTGARFFIIAALTAIVSMLFGRFYSSKKDVKHSHLEIKMNGNIYELDALCDSGNMLTEPISGKSVILVAKGSNIGKASENAPLKSRRYIPYSAVGGDGVITGVLPEYVKIDGSMANAVIASVEKKDFAGYEAIVPLSLV